MGEEIVCLECREPQKSYKGLGHHIRNRHGMSSEEYYIKYLKRDPSEGICKQCGKPTLFRSIRTGYQEFCGVKCSNVNKEKNDKTREVFKNRSDEEREEISEKARQTRRERYGDPNYGLYGSESFKSMMEERYNDPYYNNIDKIRETNLERYGVECTFQLDGYNERSLQIKKDRYGCGQNLDKLRKTNQERYGVDYFYESEDFKKKSRETQEKNYGSIEEAYKDRVRKTKKTLINRYGSENYNNSEKIQETIKEKCDKFCKDNKVVHIRPLIEKYGQGWYKSLDLKFVYYMSNAYVHEEDIPKIVEYASSNHNFIAVSRPEKEVLDYVRSIYSGEVLENKFGIIRNSKGNSLELDIFIPDRSIAIEFNGVFWHSINSGIERNYHKYKTKACEDVGVRLIHIFEDQWVNSNDICRSIISSALGVWKERIYARNCEVRDVEKETEMRFLLENHMQGYIKSSKCIGLFYRGELVQLASFGKSRFNQGATELYRLCTKKFVKVIGGFSKLLSHSDIEGTLITYVDRSLFDGSGYKKVGFKLVSEGIPSYFYVDCRNYKRYNRMYFQKKYLKDRLDVFDENKSEIENMMDNNYMVIFDSGNDKYEYKGGR